MRRGDIYLVNFKKRYQGEFGKVRPAVILQTDLLNKHLGELPYKTVALIPLTSDLQGGSFRVGLGKRDALEVESEIVINWICTLDASLIHTDKLLTQLTPDEISEVERKLLLFLGFEDRSFLP